LVVARAAPTDAKVRLGLACRHRTVVSGEVEDKSAGLTPDLEALGEVRGLTVWIVEAGIIPQGNLRGADLKWTGPAETQIALGR
jgi:hypothetical protein